MPPLWPLVSHPLFRHLLHAHGISASEYRELVGLRPRHPLQAPARSAAQAELICRRITAEPQLRAAMAVGKTLARDGKLQRLAQRALGERPPTPERERQLATSGRGWERRGRRRFAHAASSRPARSVSPAWRISTAAGIATSARD